MFIVEGLWVFRSNIKAKQTDKLSFLFFALVSRRQIAECKDRQLLVPKKCSVIFDNQLHSPGGRALIFHISLANFVVWTDESQPFFFLNFLFSLRKAKFKMKLQKNILIVVQLSTCAWLTFSINIKYRNCKTFLLIFLKEKENHSKALLK